VVCGPLAACPPGWTASSRPSWSCVGCKRGLPGPPGRLRRGAGYRLALLCLVVTGIPWRTTWQYGQRGWRHLFWDAGAIVANLLAVAAGAGWGARAAWFCGPGGLRPGRHRRARGVPALCWWALRRRRSPSQPTVRRRCPSAPGRGRCHARRAATPASAPPSAPASSPAPRRSPPGATRPAGSRPSLRPRRLRATPTIAHGQASARPSCRTLAWQSADRAGRLPPPLSGSPDPAAPRRSPRPAAARHQAGSARRQ